MKNFKKIILGSLVAATFLASLAAQARPMQVKFTVNSQAAKQMFREDNLDWKLYLTNGELRADSKELLQIMDAGQVACAVTRKPRSVDYRRDTQLSMVVSDIRDLTAYDHYDQIQEGVDFYVDLSQKSKSGATRKSSLIFSCINLKAEKVEFHKLQQALGEHISVELN